MEEPLPDRSARSVASVWAGRCDWRIDPLGKEEPPPGRPSPRVVVAIPVCNEREHIEPCLRAIACQAAVNTASIGVVLFINNTTDDTLAVIGQIVPTYPLPIRIFYEPVLRDANAGWARRCAMEAAAEWLEEASCEASSLRRVILTSDADSTVRSDWIIRNLAALEGGADAVAGMVRLNTEEARNLPRRFLLRGELECTYQRKLAELGARLTPNRHDPWPRHDSASGASIAVLLEIYRQVGGMPALNVGEDCVFLQNVVAHGFRVRHDPTIVVTTSARLVGRAVGGSADAMRLRCSAPNSRCDERLEPAPTIVGRAMGVKLPPSTVGVRPALLPLHIAVAEAILIVLRLWAALKGNATRQADSNPLEILA